MPKDLTVTALAMWGLFALGVIVGTCYCYYSDNHIDEKLGVSKGKVKLSAAIISGVFYPCYLSRWQKWKYHVSSLRLLQHFWQLEGKR